MKNETHALLAALQDEEARLSRLFMLTGITKLRLTECSTKEPICSAMKEIVQLIASLEKKIEQLAGGLPAIHEEEALWVVKEKYGIQRGMKLRQALGEEVTTILFERVFVLPGHSEIIASGPRFRKDGRRGMHNGQVWLDHPFQIQ